MQKCLVVPGKGGFERETVKDKEIPFEKPAAFYTFYATLRS